MITRQEFLAIAEKHLKVRDDGSTYIDDPILAKQYEEYLQQGASKQTTKTATFAPAQDRLNLNQQLNVNDRLASPNEMNKLMPGESLNQGDSLFSSNKQCVLDLESGGLVLYLVNADGSKSKLWEATLSEAGVPVNVMHKAYTLNMAADGDLVLTMHGIFKTPEGDAPGDGGLEELDVTVWSTGTSNNPGSYLIVQDNGNVEIKKADNTTIWSNVPTWGDGTPTSLSRVIHISDLHFTTAGKRLIAIDKDTIDVFNALTQGVFDGNLPTVSVENPYEKLANFIISNKDVWKTNLIIHTGDLTDCGDITHYEKACDFFSILQRNNFIILNVPGNHDYYKWGLYNQGDYTHAIQMIWKDGDEAVITERRKRYRQYIDGLPYPFPMDYGKLKIILLDSQSEQVDHNTDPGYTSIGTIGQINLTWLDTQLDSYQDERKNGTKVIVCLHHHPFHDGSKACDPKGRLTCDSTGGLTDAADFLRVITQRIDCLLFGHISPDGQYQTDFPDEQDFYNIPIINCENLEKGTIDNSPITVIDLEHNTKEVYPLGCLVPVGSSPDTTILASVSITLEQTIPFTSDDDKQPTHEQIAVCAYYHWQSRSSPGNDSLTDWFWAENRALWTALPTATLQITAPNPCSLTVTFPYILGFPDNASMELDIRMFVDGNLARTQKGTLRRIFTPSAKVGSGPHTLSFEARSRRVENSPPVTVYLAGVSGEVWSAGWQELPSLTTITVTAAPTKLYTFSLDSFEILNTRSCHTDTDVVCMGVQVIGDNPQYKSRYVGDFNNGNYNVGLHLDNIEIADTDKVLVMYVILNSKDVSKGIQAAEKLIVNMLEAGNDSIAQIDATAKEFSAEDDGVIGGAIGAAIGTFIPSFGLGTIIGFIVGAGVGAGLGWLWGMLSAGSCDGVVAAYANYFSGAEIARRAGAAGFFQETNPNPGTNSPSGCGDNSIYNVTWSFGDPKNYAYTPPPNTVCGCIHPNPTCNIP